MNLRTLAAALLGLSAPLVLHAQSYTWSVFAGSPPQLGSTDGAATNARYRYPAGMVFDPAGNLYVCDTLNHTIRRVAPDGSVTTLAGSPGVLGSADGTGTAARFYNPQGIAIDSARNLYVTDRFNYTIRKITPAGVVTTVAGLARNAGNSDGTGAIARFNNPHGIAVAPDGSLFVADRLNHTIRKISPGGAVTTVAGRAGTSGATDGASADARFFSPGGLALGLDGSLYVAELTNYTIRKIAPDGTVSTLAGTARSQGTANGTGPAARFNVPNDLAVDAQGDVYVADTNNDCIRKVTSAGVVTLVAGFPDRRGSTNGVGTVARFYAPAGIAMAADGTLLVADTSNQTIRRVSTAGAVSNFSGPGGNFGDTDGGGPAARFSYPQGLSLAGTGDLCVADTYNSAIRKISPEGVVSTALRLPSIQYWAVAADGVGDVIVADRSAHTLRFYVLRGTPDYFEIGTPGRSGSTDGSVLNATFNSPYGLVNDYNFAITYIADTGNHTIRRLVLTTSGTITIGTLAGSPGSSGSSDGTGSAARFNSPYGISVDRSGNVYVADTSNHTIRKITPGGTVTTLAGSPGLLGFVNGIGAAARFNRPMGITVDGSGTVYVSEPNNHSIRRISPNGAVSTIGGIGGLPDFAEGTGTNARFSDPNGIAVDAAGVVYVVDAGNNVVMRGVLDTRPNIIAPPQSAPVLAGSPVTLAVGATGGGLSYQWRLNGVEIPGATQATYSIRSAQTAAAGIYVVDVSNSAGAVTSAPATLSIVQTTNVGRIVNLAIRSQAGTGAETLIVGVGIGGAEVRGNKPVLIRCVGPALGAFGVPDVLVDPKLELFAGPAKTSENDNWGGDAQVAAVTGQVGAFSLGAASSRDAALYSPGLAPGSYTVQMTGVGGATGVVLAEIYDATRNEDYAAATPRLVNVSARTQVGTGGDILIAGFVIGGQTAKTVLIRAIGPTLGGFGVSGALADPKLDLFAGENKINENDNWGGGTALSTAFGAVGAFPLVATTRDAALLVTLAPGSYTAQVSGVRGTTGVALVEVYEIP